MSLSVEDLLLDPLDLVLKYVTLPFNGVPHDYQATDINRFATTQFSGLFHDLGLGKTFESAMIGAYKILREGFYGCYVICPQSLITQWVLTLEKMDVTVAAYRGTPAKRHNIDRNVDFLVMSYEIFRGDYEILKRDDVFFICDEATILCNNKNIIYLMLQGGQKKTVKKVEGQRIPDITVRKFDKINNGCCLLTATPINRPEDAYGLIKILVPEAYTNFQQFERVHVAKKDKFDRATDYQNMELLRENLLTNASLRHASDHIELPPIIFNNVHYDLHPKHLALYYQLLDEKFLAVDDDIVIDAMSAPAMYNWIQRLIFNVPKELYSKEPAGLELLDDVIRQADKALVFANYRATTALIMERYKAGGCHGGVTPAKQSKFIVDFKEGRLNKLICHPKSGGVGLDLPMCQHTFLPELPVTPRDFRQVCGRTHRQGQKETCVITTMIARGTIQESIFKRFLAKDDLMNEIIFSPMLLSEHMTRSITKTQLMEEMRGKVVDL